MNQNEFEKRWEKKWAEIKFKLFLLKFRMELAEIKERYERKEKANESK